MATDGVRYLAEKAGAFWLVDDIAAVYIIKKNKYPFIEVTVTSKDEKAVIKYTNGNYKKIHIQEYNYTYLPAGEYKFFITDDVLMLPSEY